MMTYFKNVNKIYIWNYSEKNYPGYKTLVCFVVNDELFSLSKLSSALVHRFGLSVIFFFFGCYQISKSNAKKIPNCWQAAGAQYINVLY